MNDEANMKQSRLWIGYKFRRLYMTKFQKNVPKYITAEIFNRRMFCMMFVKIG